MSILRKSNNKSSSRQQIAISGVEDDVLLLPGNKYRVIFEATPINFELKSEEEQDALIEVYQNFLNSLACPLQTIVSVRELDIDKYLDEFRTRVSGEAEEVYRQEMIQYTEFVQSLITKNKILTRHFYIVVPFDARERVEFSLVKEQLTLRSAILRKGLGRLGVQTKQLHSLELLDLFYTFYNPTLAKRQPLTEQTMRMLKEVYV